MTDSEHIKIHKEWHKTLNLIVAHWVSETNGLPSKATVLDLIKWSYSQAQPAEVCYVSLRETFIKLLDICTTPINKKG